MCNLSEPEAMCNECGEDILDPTWWELERCPSFYDFCDSCITKMGKHPDAAFERLESGRVRLVFPACLGCGERKELEYDDKYYETLPEMTEVFCLCIIEGYDEGPETVGILRRVNTKG
jgi:hypothetical protein